MGQDDQAASAADTQSGATQRMIVIDTGVALFVNAIVFPFGLLAAGLPPPQTMLGPNGALLDAALATACPVILMTILMTLVLRARFRRQLPADAGAYLARSSRTPARMILRSITLALIALAFLVPLRLVIIWALGLLPMDSRSHLALNIFHGCLIGLAFMPIIFLETLADFPGAGAARGK